MSDDTLAVVLLVLAVLCLGGILLGLAGVLFVSGRESDAERERDEPERWR